MKTNTIISVIYTNLMVILLLCAAISLSGCSNTETPAEPVTEPSTASQTPSKPSVDYKSLAPKPEEFADGNEFFVTSGNDETQYTYMVSAVTPDQFQLCKNVLTEGKFPDVVLNMSQTFLAMHEDGETCARVFYYPGMEGGDGSDAYLILTITAYDQEGGEQNAEDGNTSYGLG